MRVVAIAQARLGSTRLPGKVLARVGARTVLERVVDARRDAATLDDIAVAIPVGDSELVAEGSRLGVRVVEGEELDVLSRYVHAARVLNADAIVRITADCPLLDPSVIDELVNRFRSRPSDYLSVEGYPRGVGEVEVIARAALERATEDATKDDDREHVTKFVARHVDRFSVVMLRAPDSFFRPSYRLCVDEADDLEAVRAVHRRLGEPDGPVRVSDVVALLDASPELVEINRSVHQRS